MIKPEIEQWIKTAKLVHSEGEYDEYSNYDNEIIYEKEGKLYRICFCNGVICEEWGEKGWIRGNYKPEEVRRHEEKIVEITYIPVENKNENIKRKT